MQEDARLKLFQATQFLSQWPELKDVVEQLKTQVLLI